MKKVNFLSLLNIAINIAIFGIYVIAGIFLWLRCPSASKSFYLGLWGSAAVMSLTAVVLTTIIACKLPANAKSRINALSIASALYNYLILAFIGCICLNMFIGGPIANLFLAGIYLAMTNSGLAIVLSNWLKKDIIKKTPMP